MKTHEGIELVTRTAWVQRIIILCPKCGSDCNEIPVRDNLGNYLWKGIDCTGCEFRSTLKEE